MKRDEGKNDVKGGRREGGRRYGGGEAKRER